MPSCCACSDTRELSETGYEGYVDGVGYTETASRDAFYCGVCNTKNYDRWVKKVREETERKEEEDRVKREKEGKRREVRGNANAV